ncbi:MAG: alpha-ketoacid dehydrogenase subunit beta [Gammaproteobacteria bacterium]|nr:alpha-ketoacid dehydrogenase subunit beta [Gammaproteobacteria bacterium]
MDDTTLYWQALNRALDSEMAADDSVIMLGEDVGLYGGTYRVTEGLMAKYGEWRVRDTPISENSFVGLGVGAALAGLRPIVEIMTVNFALLAMDAIVNMAAKIPFMSGGQFAMPLTIRMPGGVARQLGAQHSQRLEVLFMNVPGLRMVVPSTVQDAWWQLRQAIRSNDPVIVLEHERLYFSKGPLDETADPPPPHQAVVRCTGADVTLIAWSRMTEVALAAARSLRDDHVAAEVIDLRSLLPIDWTTCQASLDKTHRCLIVDETSRFGGAGAEIAATLQERCFFSLDAPIARVAGLDIPVPFNGALEESCIPGERDVIDAVHRLIGRP